MSGQLDLHRRAPEEGISQLNVYVADLMLKGERTRAALLKFVFVHMPCINYVRRLI